MTMPPSNVDAEEALLGSMIIDTEIIGDIASFLKPEHFYREQNRWIYEAILTLFDDRQPIDFITLFDVLRKRNQLEEMGGEGYVISLISTVPTAINGDAYAKIVKDAAVRRKMISAASTIANIANEEDSTSAEERVEQSERIVMGLREDSGNEDVKDSEDAARAYLDYLDRSRDGGIIGFKTGYFEYDEFTGGLASPFMHVLAARTGMGKSAWVIGLLDNAGINGGQSILLFSLEMTIAQIMQRVVAKRTGIGLHNLRLGNLSELEWAKVNEAVGRFSQSKIFIDETPNLTPGAARAKANRIARKHGLDLIVYDHLHLMQSEKYSGNPVKEVGEISRQVMFISKELGIPSVLAAQLNRGLEDRKDKRPVLRDLRESGEIEQNAYSVTFLYRDDYYNPVDSTRRGLAEVIVSKNRDGSPGTVELLWSPRTASFSNIVRRVI